jgi:PIN domain nuclease of toxin-antitoxin system
VRALLDTHTFLWWNLDDKQLSPTARACIADGSNEIFLSAATGWEIAIKAAKGRLSLPEVPDRYVADRMSFYGLLPLPIELSHTLQVYHLPPLHQDPFDRLLIAQSQLEQLPLLTADADIARYEVKIIW